MWCDHWHAMSLSHRCEKFRCRHRSHGTIRFLLWQFSVAAADDLRKPDQGSKSHRHPDGNGIRTVVSRGPGGLSHCGSDSGRKWFHERLGVWGRVDPCRSRIHVGSEARLGRTEAHGESLITCINHSVDVHTLGDGVIFTDRHSP